MPDTGLLCSKFGLNSQNLLLNPLQLDGVKGALAENYVASALQVNGYVPYYWESEGKAEIDFIIQHKQGDIIPVDINLF